MASSTPLRIGIDGYNLAMPHGTGVATYGRALAETLKAHGHRIEGVFGIDPGRDAALREILFFDRFGHAPTAAEHARDLRRAWLAGSVPGRTARTIEVPLDDRVDTTSLADRLPRFDRLVTSPLLFRTAHRHFALYGRFLPLTMPDPPQVMHWTYPVPVRLNGSANVYTFHDIVPLRLPHTVAKTDKRLYRALLQGCIDRADGICTVSEASRADILADFAIDPAGIVNCYQTTPAPASETPADPHLAERLFRLPERSFFLFFGAVEPKKNVGRLLEAFLSLDSKTPLVLVGTAGWQSEQELALITDRGGDPARAAALDARLIRFDHLPRRLLAHLIGAARAVVFPSISEGFGLPILEAMQAGTPVLTSNIGAPAEIAADAALLVDPFDPQMIADGLRTLDTDDDLRTRLAAAGLRRARAFSQEAFGARLEAFYERAREGSR